MEFIRYVFVVFLYYMNVNCSAVPSKMTTEYKKTVKWGEKNKIKIKQLVKCLIMN